VNRQGVLYAVGIVAIASFYQWLFDAWENSPIDGTIEPLLAVLAVGWAVLVSRRVGGSARTVHLGALPVVLLSCIIAGAGLWLDIYVMQLVGILGILWSLTWVISGTELAFLGIPWLGWSLLALPTSTFNLGQFAAFAGFDGISGITLKLMLAFLLGGMGLVLLIAKKGGWQPRMKSLTTTYLAVAISAISAVGFAFQPSLFGPALQIDTTRYGFGNWVGMEISTSSAEQQLYKDAHITKRLYADNQGNQIVALFVTASNIHQLHNPEYCLTGSGWRIQSHEQNLWPTGSAATPVRAIRATRNNNRLTSLYWFSSSTRSSLDIAGVRLQHQRDADGPVTLYQLTALEDNQQASDHMLTQFLEAAPWIN
jgi:hypothetical protein